MQQNGKPGLRRDLGLIQATALAITDMIGIGPFITIPLFLSTMGGPQAMIGWLLGAFLAFCDGLVWCNWGQPCRKRAEAIIIFEKPTAPRASGDGFPS